MNDKLNELWRIVEETLCDNMSDDAIRYFERVFKNRAEKTLLKQWRQSPEEDMRNLSRENKSLLLENELLFAQNKQLNSLVTSQRLVIDTLKEELEQLQL